jgi:hypothetical protein
MQRLKLVVLGIWLIALGSFLLFDSPTTRAQTSVPLVQADMPSIERFDNVIQQRFLNSPGFGGARIAPRTPQPLRSNHVGGFTPRDEAERSILNKFAGWDVGIYLFGRWTMPDEKAKTKKFKMRYRAIQPIPVTPGRKEGDFPKAKKIADEVKNAFFAFQSVSEADQKPYEFSRGDWRYIATPVRVANQSCIQCHTDYVATERRADGRFSFRKKTVGDVNGILVYALRRSEH